MYTYQDLLRGLRALLIQEDAKRSASSAVNSTCLRALLIQEDAKHSDADMWAIRRLRALLIQEDAKHKRKL